MKADQAGSTPATTKISTDMQKSLPVATARACPGNHGIRKVWTVATAKGDTDSHFMKLNMLIAIDFDETLTADAKLWDGFIGSCKQLGHSVICVTARRDTDENRETITEWMRMHLGYTIPVFYSNLGSKLHLMKERGLKPDIWIDDDPESLVRGR